MRSWHVDQPGPVGAWPGAGPLAERDTPVPEPGPGELLLRVLACGVCRTDLHVTEGDLPVHRPGVTPGHEVVGEVVAAGRAVTRFKPGDGVGIGKDDTLYARAAGTVQFAEGRRGRVVSVLPDAE